LWTDHGVLEGAPRRTSPDVEESVLSLHRERRWGRRRIAHALGLPEGTSAGATLGKATQRGRSARRSPLSVAKEPLRLSQVDTKDILCFVSLMMGWLRAWGIDVEVDWQEELGSEFVGERSVWLS